MALKSRVVPLALRHILPPAFLCPAIASITPRVWHLGPCDFRIQRRQYGDAAPSLNEGHTNLSPTLLSLPLQCPGCGAFTQNTAPENAGYYSTSRKSVKTFLAQCRASQSHERQSEAEIFDQVLGNTDESLLQSLGLNGMPHMKPDPPAEISTPVCNRCHDLVHHHTGVPVVHPTLASIQDIISESPYKYNHIYHVLDAADFPFSLIPQLDHHLSLTPQRSLNRRSKTGKYYQGRKAEMSFIITRSDLLAPRKEQVDSLMPYLLEVLRDALGQTDRDVRLGNVRCVSSKRGWWTKEVKEAIWDRGGGGWMVGKVNVGKSSLFECIFPKGRNQEVNYQSLRHDARPSVGYTAVKPSLASRTVETTYQERQMLEDSPQHENEVLPEHSLLPPAPAEKRFPVMPVVSSLPGTTASPIRLLFGNGKGELIDLPGLQRGNLEDYVSDEYKQDLVMRQRVTPETLSIKPGQSLLVGGIIRITPARQDQILLAYPFLPLKCHVGSTEKVTSLQAQQTSSGVPTMARAGAGDMMRSAGLFELKWDVTRHRTGPLTRPSAVGLKAEALPFVVYSADLLIEGCGWIELVVQVRKRDIESQAIFRDDINGETSYPKVEVFSPYGKHVATRRPMNAWLLGGPKPVAVADRTTRPRRSMKGVKKNMKKAARAGSQT